MVVTHSTFVRAEAFTFENMATLALAVNLITYFNGVMHFNIADAANIVTNYAGTSYILSVLGFVLLTVQAHLSKLRPPPCNILDPANSQLCVKVDGGNSALMYTSSSLPTHGADQFYENDPKEATQMSSFFNFLLLAICIGGGVSITFIVYIQDNKGCDWGFGISTVAILLSMIVFSAGLPLYRYHVISGTAAITEIIQVYIASVRNRRLKLPEDSDDLYEIDRDKEAGVQMEFLPHRDNLRFLDKAAIQTSLNFEDSTSANPWKLCRVTQVENAKIILGMIPIFCCTIIMSTCLSQLQTFSIQQGITMDTTISHNFHIPPASLPIIPIGFMIIIIPLYDQIAVPFIRKYTGHPTEIIHLQRIGVGLVLSSISMGTAALIEVKRKNVARSNNMLNAIPVLQPFPISVFWLSFQYFIFGIADMFSYVGLLEFFHSEAPKGVKSISTCFLWSSMALGYFFSTVLVQIVNQATKASTKSGGWLAGNNINVNHVNLFYWLLAILSLINFFSYLFWATRYQYRHQDIKPPLLTRR
ncbi:hypothetical protein MKX01_036589 [Papaver californicum]|nr:hypothetical protein MKX01_036589 [Papaver californicum]